jgi:hypothetical protein
MKNSGFSAKLKVCVFEKSHCHTKSKVLFNLLLLIHSKRYLLCLGDRANSNNSANGELFTTATTTSNDLQNVL